jgi:hypothetical protein
MLFLLVVLAGGMAEHVLAHHAGDMQAFEWISGAFSTLLGALVMVLTGRISRADGQTANGAPPTPPQAEPPAPPVALKPIFERGK